jgi:hypothetical protein
MQTALSQIYLLEEPNISVCSEAPGINMLWLLLTARPRCDAVSVGEGASVGQEHIASIFNDTAATEQQCTPTFRNVGIHTPTTLQHIPAHLNPEKCRRFTNCSQCERNTTGPVQFVSAVPTASLTRLFLFSDNAPGAVTCP